MNPAVPETNGGVGASFKGTAQYLLHDKGALSDDRVLWTQTLNLAVDDPQLAWRIMAATALDSNRLKHLHHEQEQLALPPEDRTAYKASKKSFNHVYHYALTWSPEEAPQLSREVMMQQAKGSLRAIGASDLQALVVCHMDTHHPHIHVMVNRVHPETGQVINIESNAHRKLSRYSLKLDKERGFTYAPQREINAQKREAGIFYTAEQRIPRKIYEQQTLAAQSISIAPERATRVQKVQAALDRQASTEEKRIRADLKTIASQLAFEHRKRKAMINDEADHAKQQAKKILSAQYNAQFQDMAGRMQVERKQLTETEQTHFGRFIADLKAIGTSWDVSGDKNLGERINETFEGFGKRGYAALVLSKAHDRERQKLACSYRGEVRQHFKGIEETRQSAISDNYQRYLKEYEEISVRKISVRREIHSLWKMRDQMRGHAWQKFSKSVQLERDFEAAASAKVSKTNAADDRELSPEERRARKKEAIKTKLKARDDREKGR